MQTSEPDADYSTLTVMLVVVFIVLVTIVAGLLLRSPAGRSTARADSAFDARLPLESARPASTNVIDRSPLQSELPRRPGEGLKTSPMSAGEPVWLRSSGFSQNAKAVSNAVRSVQQLLESSSQGQTRSGFELYTGTYLDRFLVSHDLDAASFTSMLNAAVPAPTPIIGIESIVDISLESPELIEVTVNYVQSGGHYLPSERYRLLLDETGRWLIDDISSIG